MQDEYNCLFDIFSPKGYPIPGPRLKPFFLQTTLTEQQLGEIWDMSDIDRDGCLDRMEFVSACSLIKSFADLLGKSVNFKLPGTEDKNTHHKLTHNKSERKLSSAANMWESFASLIHQPTLDDKDNKYRESFKRTDINCCGYLTGDQARPLLSSYKLQRTILAKIWNDVDPTGSGKINIDQFVSAMKACDALTNKPNDLDKKTPLTITASTKKSIIARRKMETEVQADFEQSQRKVLNDRLSRAKQEHDQLKASVQTAQHEYTNIEDKVYMCRNKLTSLNRDNDTLQIRTTEIQNDHIHIELEIEKIQKLYQDISTQYKNKVKQSKDLDTMLIELNEHSKQDHKLFAEEIDLKKISEELNKSSTEESNLRQQIIDSKKILEDLKTSMMTLERESQQKWNAMDKAEDQLSKIQEQEISKDNSDVESILKLISKLTEMDLSSKRPKLIINACDDPFKDYDPFENEFEDSCEWQSEMDKSPISNNVDKIDYGLDALKLYPDLTETLDNKNSSLFPNLRSTDFSDRKFPFVARSLQSYTGKRENHLSFDEGAFINIRSQQDDWYSGEINGKIGWLPKSTVSAMTENSSIILKHSTHLCRAIYDFKSEVPGDLHFQKNDIIVLESENKKWWIGHIGSRQGSFPSNYVELIEITNRLPDALKGEYMVKAMFDYIPIEAHKQNDLDFKRGNSIKIIGSAGESWLFGHIGTRYGMLPVNYVQRVSKLTD